MRTQLRMPVPMRRPRPGRRLYVVVLLLGLLCAGCVLRAPTAFADVTDGAEVPQEQALERQHRDITQEELRRKLLTPEALASLEQHARDLAMEGSDLAATSEAFHTAVKIRGIIDGGDSESFAALLGEAGAAALAAHEWGEATVLLADEVAMRRVVQGNHHRAHTHARLRLARAHAAAFVSGTADPGTKAAANEHLREAERLFRGVVSFWASSDSKSARRAGAAASVELGRLQQAAGAGADAASSSAGALEALDTAVGPTHPESLAAAALAGDIALAGAHHKNALRLCERVLPHTRTAASRAAAAADGVEASGTGVVSAPVAPEAGAPNQPVTAEARRLQAAWGGLGGPSAGALWGQNITTAGAAYRHVLGCAARAAALDNSWHAAQAHLDEAISLERDLIAQRSSTHGQLPVMGAGNAPDDARLQSYLALAEQVRITQAESAQEL